MNLGQARPMTFQQRYLELRGLSDDSPEAFSQALLRECLYPHARLLRGLLLYFEPKLFSADIDLVHALASLTRRSQLNDCLYEHSHHPHNRGAARKTFRLRLSVGKLQRILNGCMPSERREIPRRHTNAANVVVN